MTKAPPDEAGVPSGPLKTPIGATEAEALFSAFDAIGILVVAVSGGADSAALLRLLARWAKRPGRPTLVVATIDHGVRPDGAEEARRVMGWAEALGLQGVPRRLASGAKGHASLREARYAALRAIANEVGARHVALAHHRDDQAETVLLRLARGSGLRGLAGMTAERERDGVVYVRPLLPVPAIRLRATCRAMGQEWIEDPSNADPRYARARLRALAPDLAVLGLTPERLSETARRLARAQQAIDAVVAERLCGARAHPIGLVTCPLDAFDAPDEIALRMLEALLRTVGGQSYPPRMERSEALLEDLRRGARSPRRTLHGCVVARVDGLVHVYREAGRTRPTDIRIEGGGPGLWDARFVIAADGPVTVGCAPRRPMPDVPPGIDPRSWRAAVAMAPALLEGEGASACLRCDPALEAPTPLTLLPGAPR